MVHEFEKSNKTITTIVKHPRVSNYFISVSLDSGIKVCDLGKYQTVYTFELPSGLRYVKMLSSSKLVAYFQDGITKSGYMNFAADLFFPAKQLVRKIGKCFINESKKPLNDVHLVWSLFTDNSIQFQSPLDLSQEVICTIFPPPSAREVI